MAMFNFLHANDVARRHAALIENIKFVLNNTKLSNLCKAAWILGAPEKADTQCAQEFKNNTTLRDALLTKDATPEHRISYLENKGITPLPDPFKNYFEYISSFRKACLLGQPLSAKTNQQVELMQKAWNQGTWNWTTQELEKMQPKTAKIAPVPTTKSPAPPPPRRASRAEEMLMLRMVANKQERQALKRLKNVMERINEEPGISAKCKSAAILSHDAMGLDKGDRCPAYLYGKWFDEWEKELLAFNTTSFHLAVRLAFLKAHDLPLPYSHIGNNKRGILDKFVSLLANCIRLGTCSAPYKNKAQADLYVDSATSAWRAGGWYLDPRVASKP